MGLLSHQNAERAVDIEGAPISGARLRIFHSGTDSLARIYEDQNLTYSQENPMKANAGGHFAQCFLPKGDYRICLEDPLSTTMLAEAEVTVAIEASAQDMPEITALQQDLDGKANVGHSHPANDVVGLQDMISSALSSVSGATVYRGGWDASSQAYPAGALVGDTFSVTVAGIVESTAYEPGDQIIANTADAATVGEWDHIRPAVSLEEFGTVEELLGDSQGMAIGRTVPVAGGQFRYQVADPTASDYCRN